MQGMNLTKIASTVTNFFKLKATEIDETVRFVKRESKLDAKLFAEALIMGCLSDPRISLERLSEMLKSRGVDITKQGLHQRFTPEATELMRCLTTEALKEFKTEDEKVLSLLEPFSDVKILDSTGMALPNNLKDVFKGHGGSGSEAGLKIQVLLSYTEGQINQLTITEGTINDQGFNGHLKDLKKNTLYLQDLGYFKLTFFEAARDKGAYFISRYSYPTAVMNEKGERLDLINELRKSESVFAKNIRLGKKEQIEMRLIAFRLPAEELAKRLKKLRKKAQKSGRALTAETLELAKWSIYITNVAESLLKNEQIHLVYSLRWQIELLFKLCKSEAGLANISGKKSNRILCEIYAKLICVATMLYLCFPMRWQENRELSFYKAYKSLKLKALNLFKALRSVYKLTHFLKSFLNGLLDCGFKDKHRKKRRLTYQKIMDATGQEGLA